ncbi:hypothetical protein D1605_002265 [Xylella fastidiosa subsp. fastidiosa]|uniref:hypothetical protein n=1 Tax=Xylella fastidiosa TaxID=2371 RepID=UPI0002144462|nr:hypothetical protein [Xylella fastidiosa]EGO81472.1 hypothetical protein XFEB_01663 [Xylella fastidiosa EB92.1]MBE0261947.1 hypothetical protein [Xylella fastidiosa subsp. fastidiosa]MBE0264076.1 hypothetical protein [Xylella fastidiosa subsp. fastidiosa]MBE0266318.1 hypothetical protein [Xylella fastidiosa subsp. fastidiosa]MBE0270750.1 hypothetical protein [Xylella fastidiosa subsp. fastidiosa]
MAKQATQQANYLAHFSKAKSIKINEKHLENTTPDTVMPSEKINAGLNFSRTSVSNAKEPSHTPKNSKTTPSKLHYQVTVMFE